MRQAIVTRYLPATDNKPSRVKAIADAGTVTLSWDHALDGIGNHREAALMLCLKHGWATIEEFDRLYYVGGLPRCMHGAYVFVDGAYASFERSGGER